MRPMTGRQKRVGVGSLMRGAAWGLRLQLLLSGFLLFALGFGSGWTAHWPEPPAVEPRPETSPTPRPAPLALPAPLVVKLVPSPACGPKGLTETDVRLACQQGWMKPEEAALVGLKADCGSYRSLPEGAARALRASEDQTVAELAKAAPQDRLCAPIAISADAVRLACRARQISTAFARLLGIDAIRPERWEQGCQLAPAEEAALERDEAAAVKSR